MEKRNNQYHIIYSIMVAMFVFMVVWLAVKNYGKPQVMMLLEDHIAFDSGWLLEDGSEADMAHINKNPGVEPYKEVSVYHKLPEDLKEGSSFCFRSKNIFYKVYVGGELRYDPEVPESSIYNNSFGTRWNYIPLSQKDAGKDIEVCLYTVYDRARACMDYLYVGAAVAEMLNMYYSKMVALVTCLLLLFVGIFLVIADVPINIQTQKNHELLYLGMFALSIAVWCTSETNLLQFLTNDSRLLQIVSCCSLMLVPIPMVLYLDAAFGFRKRRIVPIICYMSAGEFALCTILHFAKIMDYHDTLRLSHVMLAISAVILIATILQNSFRPGKSQVKNIYKIMRTVGLTSIAVAAFIDILRYYRGNGGDSAMFVRIGLLIFILCYGSSSMEKTINAVKLGIQTQFVSQLAYRDGLTGIGNRTAFQECLVELETEKHETDGIGIIMFDVNDLKYVNDHMGHQAGDDMLVCSADMIKSALEPEQGTCYRIGGDEFAVVVSGEDVQRHCEQGLLRFDLAMKEYNDVPNQPFRISVASGYAVYDETGAEEKLMDLYQQADRKMYENKKKMKSLQMTPEEYYSRK